ncbi:hypothetical protein DNTS_016347 [Danionella cerebrum]|uniref:Cadherin domain-containing protein n=1 Tax=Danionella cerebrum TaxID=2873325 RepID=A0A553MZB9_9TELE|nr:hypothetical protein DNTS_016347 [Danionella translucida]
MIPILCRFLQGLMGAGFCERGQTDSDSCSVTFTGHRRSSGILRSSLSRALASDAAFNEGQPGKCDRRLSLILRQREIPPEFSVVLSGIESFTGSGGQLCIKHCVLYLPALRPFTRPSMREACVSPSGIRSIKLNRLQALLSLKPVTKCKYVLWIRSHGDSTSVMKVMASDADDPMYGSSARIVYNVLDGERFFSVDKQTGVIRTAVADLDRETQDRYELVVKATDMAGQMGGLSGSTTVTIVITDVNDNPPRFPQKMYQFSVSEGAVVGTPVGRVIATDADMGENTDMSFLIKDEEGAELFRVSTDGDTQEALITIRKPLDFESKRTHNVVVEAVNKHVDPRFVDLGSFRDQTIVRVSVSDVDEPPIFIPASGTIMEVQEDARLGALVGIVTARDPDMDNVPVRFSLNRSSEEEQIFFIDPVSGAITLGKVLDRETAGWHNITVTAVEADNQSMASQTAVSIRILDVNDNPPELATPYEASICEDAKPGQRCFSDLQDLLRSTATIPVCQI